MTTSMTTRDIPSSLPATTPHLPAAELRDFFDRLAGGDYYSLAKELCIPRTIKRYPRATTVVNQTEDAPTSTTDHRTQHSFDEVQDPDTSARSTETDTDADGDQSFRFQATAEGLQRAASLVRGEDAPARAPTPAEEEAFQFTFRLMIHKLYSIRDFAQMAEEVVRASRARFRPLERDARGGFRRESLSFAFAHEFSWGEDVDGSFAPFAPEGECESMVYSPESVASSVPLPRSPPGWGSDHFSVASDTEDVRAVKKRIVGRKLSVVDGVEDEVLGRGNRAWVYDTAVASVDDSSGFDISFSPTAASPMRISTADREDCVSPRKRRFSFLSARGL